VRVLLYITCHEFPGLEASLQLYHEHLCKYIHDTPVGAVLKSVEPDNCEVFYNLYLHDFVMGIHRCKHKSPDLIAMEVSVSAKQNNSISDSVHSMHCLPLACL
jgi:hypothetical protein